MNKKTLSLTLLTTTLVSGVAIAFAWTGPTASPFGNNAAVPINASASAQTKSGSFTAGGLGSAGSLIVAGNTTLGGSYVPRAALDVAGNIITDAGYALVPTSYYNILGSTLGAGTSIYSYGRLCTNTSVGNCTGTGGITIGGATPNASSVVSISEGNTIFNGGNVGIGTASPTQRLSVAGTIQSSSGGFQFPDGTTQTTAAGTGSFIQNQYSSAQSASAWINGNFKIQNGSPTIYLQDTDNKSAMIHNNSNLLYFLSGCGASNSDSWCTNGSAWPLTINLTNDTSTFGGNVSIADSGTFQTSNSSWFPHSNGNNYLRGNTYFNGVLYDENNSAYYVDPSNISVFNDLRSNIWYDRDDTNFYINGNGMSNLSGVQSSIFVNTSSDPYFRTNANNKHIVLSGGSGWADTGATIVLRGVSSPTEPSAIQMYAGNAERLKILSNGNVGIGDSNPGQRLTVGGIIHSTSGGIRFPDGTTQTTAATAIDAILNQTATNQPASFRISGTGSIQDQIRFNWAAPIYGVGIATDSSGGWSRRYGFTNTAGTAVLGGFGGYGGVNSLSTLWIGTDYNNASIQVTPSNKQVKLETSTGDTWFGYNGGTLNYLRGNTYFSGILYDESNASFYLDPAATSALNVLNTTGAITSNSTVTGTRVIGRVSSSEGGSLGISNPSKTGSNISDWVIWNMTGAYGNGLSFWRYAGNGTNVGSAVWFGDNGNVGIGTASPTQRLSVAGTIQSSSGGFQFPDGTTQTTAAGTGSFIQNQYSSAQSASAWINGNFKIQNGSPTIYLQDTDNKSAMLHNNSNQFYILNSAVNNSTTWSTNGSYWPLQIDLTNDSVTLGGNVWIPEGTLQTSGNVGIKQAPCAYALCVSGDIYANSAWLRSSGNAGWYSETYGGGWYMTDATWIRGYGSKPLYMDTGLDTGGNSGIGCGGARGGAYMLQVCGAAGVGAAAYYYTSDARLKDNLVPLQDSLSKVRSLQGYTFNWKEGGRADVGVIAQEVEKVFPQLVKTDAKGFKSVEYGNLVAPLIEAVKELATQANALAQRIFNLEIRQTELEKQNELQAQQIRDLQRQISEIQAGR